MSSISVSKMKIFKDCKLQFKYKYIDKWYPVDEKKEDVTAKGLVLHQCFENILKYENYKDGNACLPYRTISEEEVLKILKTAIEENELSIQSAKNFRIKLGLKRWLDFKHNYLDKTGHKFYAEKEYEQIIFGDTTTKAILDLLEDNGDDTYCIYDYKTPQKACNSNYKKQLLIYAYMIAIVLGLIKPDSENYKIIADKFKIFVFYPLLEGDEETYKGSLKPVKFKEEDVKEAIEALKEADEDIKGFNFKASANVLMPFTVKYTCDWCEYCGAKRQEINGEVFEGCPITAYAGVPCKHEFKRPDPKPEKKIDKK